MAKKATGNTKVDCGYTPEQVKEIQEFFKNNDFTAMMAVERTASFSGENAKVYKRTKDLFSKYWLNNLGKLGIMRMMKNFTREYPIKALQNADADHFSEQIVDIYSDDEQLGNAVEQFFGMYSGPICAGLEAYSKNFGRDVETLTDEEIMFVVEKVAEVLDEELIKVIMLGQQVPEVYGITAATPAHEDFNRSLSGNFDLINFHDKWTHCKTKLGAPLSLDELIDAEYENGSTELEHAKNFFDHADTRTQKEYEELRDAFANTLNSTDREIYILREKGYTQEEIRVKLGYKTHSAVSKRLKIMQGKLHEFIADLEGNK